MRDYRDFVLAGVGKRLREVRDHFKLSQKEIAKKLEISTDSYLRNERDLNHPGYKTLSLLSKEFNVSMDWILLGHGEMFRFDKTEVDRMRQFLAGLPPELNRLVKAMSQVPLLYHEQMTHFYRFMQENKELFVPPPKTTLPDPDPGDSA